MAFFLTKLSQVARIGGTGFDSDVRDSHVLKGNSKHTLFPSRLPHPKQSWGWGGAEGGMGIGPKHPLIKQCKLGNGFCAKDICSVSPRTGNVGGLVHWLNSPVSSLIKQLNI